MLSATTASFACPRSSVRAAADSPIKGAIHSAANRRAAPARKPRPPSAARAVATAPTSCAKTPKTIINSTSA